MSDLMTERPRAAVRRSRISWVWIIPIVAALIAGYLGWRTLRDQGPLITISFRSGEGITAGQTRVRYKAVELGTVETVRLAEDMTHVLAPRPGGVLAALDAAPDADVLMVAHTGLDHLVTVSDLWRELPMDKQITMRWWQVSRDEIPEGRDERIEWLYGWWERVDAWVEENRVDS